MLVIKERVNNMSSQKLKTLPGYALIQLHKKYESGLVADKDKYSTNSSGMLVNFTMISPPDNSRVSLEEISKEYADLMFKTVYFTPYEDGDVIKLDDKEYVFIPISALRGGLF